MCPEKWGIDQSQCSIDHLKGHPKLSAKFQSNLLLYLPFLVFEQSCLIELKLPKGINNHIALKPFTFTGVFKFDSCSKICKFTFSLLYHCTVSKNNIRPIRYTVSALHIICMNYVCMYVFYV